MTDSSRDNTMDWNRLYARLRAAQASLNDRAEPDAETRARILHERAQRLAQEPRDAEDERETLEVVVFRLANELYGIESRYVEQVYPLRDYTPIPCTPVFVLGIVNVRGTIVSVIDIRKIFSLPESGLTDLNKTLILSDGNTMFGILADALVDVRKILVTEIQTTLPTMTGIRETYLRGVTKDGLIILEATTLLSDRQLVVHQTVQPRAMEKGSQQS